MLRKLLVLTAVAVVATVIVGTTTAQAKSTTEKRLMIRFYHVDGFIKSIGHVARRTIYNPNPQIRIKWVRTIHYLVRVRAKTKAAIDRLRQPPRPAHYEQWLCIHHYEGSWTADTGNGYYGGLQMDDSFQKTYGWDVYKIKGSADHWTPLEQMQAAEKAYKTRGFYPWPNTARACGLI